MGLLIAERSMAQARQTVSEEVAVAALSACGNTLPARVDEVRQAAEEKARPALSFSALCLSSAGAFLAQAEDARDAFRAARDALTAAIHRAEATFDASAPRGAEPALGSPQLPGSAAADGLPIAGEIAKGRIWDARLELAFGQTDMVADLALGGLGRQGFPRASPLLLLPARWWLPASRVAPPFARVSVTKVTQDRRVAGLRLLRFLWRTVWGLRYVLALFGGLSYWVASASGEEAESAVRRWASDVGGSVAGRLQAQSVWDGRAPAVGARRNVATAIIGDSGRAPTAGDRSGRGDNDEPDDDEAEEAALKSQPRGVKAAALFGRLQ